MRIQTQDMIFAEVYSWYMTTSVGWAVEAINNYRSDPEKFPLTKVTIQAAFKKRYEAVAVLDSAGFGLFSDRSKRPRHWRNKQEISYEIE